MVDTKDSKSFGGNSVTVQVRSPALNKKTLKELGVFLFLEDGQGGGRGTGVPRGGNDQYP
jgi:hypothetical protein